LWVAEAIAEVPAQWRIAWPDTDFSKTTVDLSEIRSGGPGKDGIPAIDQPRFVPLSEYREAAGDEPVVSVTIGGESRAYPLRILLWHEIVNDTLGGVPIAVTYCPLCNTSVVFDRRLDNQVLDFGTTGNLRHSDLVMYDGPTESWWQQYDGTAIVGKLAGKRLKILPSRLESLDEFRGRVGAAEVLVPNDPRFRNYGTNPYVGYDRSAVPFLYGGALPQGIEPMMRVVAVGETAWTLPLVREAGELRQEGLELRWRGGQRSALDSAQIAEGREVGTVTVTRGGADVPHVVTFAFAFFAFNPDGVLHTPAGPLRQSGGRR
jgi:hypothetical protein